jgi:TRAP-type C4-dicarboxylate transport system permease small subunit
MVYIEKIVAGLSSMMFWMARFAILAMMILTCSDVFLRYLFNRPIIGTYDLVCLLGAILIGFSIPRTSLDKGHIIMEFLIDKLPGRAQNIFNFLTRCLAVAVFGIFGWNLILKGNVLLRVGEVSPTLRMPIYYIAYALGFCCFVECLVLINELIRKLRRVAA